MGDGGGLGSIVLLEMALEERVLRSSSRPLEQGEGRSPCGMEEPWRQQVLDTGRRGSKGGEQRY